jgi:septal ring factor EnvC (AmiA/AmiB activator)
MMPLTGGHASLLDRVKRMINKKNKNLTTMEKVFLSLSIVAVISLSFIPASDAKTAKQKQAQQANVNTSATSRVATSYSSSETLLFKSITQTNAETAVAELDKENEVNQQLQDSIINVHSYTVANPSKRTDYMEITVMSGNRYKIAKENGVIVSFSINGVERDVREVANYSAMIKTVETRAAVAEKEREKAEKEREKIEKRRDEVDARRASIEQERQVVEQKRQQAEQKRLEAEGRTEAPESHRATIEQRRGEIEQRRAEAEQHRIEAEQRHIEAEAKHKIAMAKREQAFRIHDSLKAVQAQKVKDIINLLVKTGVVKSPESVQWFSLTDAALVVNGQQQDAALHQQLVKAYGIQPDLGLYYGNVPGPAKGYFFGRHEIDLAR